MLVDNKIMSNAAELTEASLAASRTTMKSMFTTKSTNVQANPKPGRPREDVPVPVTDPAVFAVPSSTHVLLSTHKTIMINKGSASSGETH